MVLLRRGQDAKFAVACGVSVRCEETGLTVEPESLEVVHSAPGACGLWPVAWGLGPVDWGLGRRSSQ